MRNRILAIAAIAGAIGCTDRGAGAERRSRRASSAAAPWSSMDIDGIAVEQRPAFREYVVRERVPTYTIPDRVIVGGVLPEAGITYYDVPQTYRRDALSLHRGERPDRAGRTAHRVASFRWSINQIA